MADVGGVAADRLRSFIERWERLQEEIDALKEDQKQVMAEAKGTGFDVPTVRKLLKRRKDVRKKGQAAVDEQEALLDIYAAALGDLNGTPLGNAAIQRLTQMAAVSVQRLTEMAAPPVKPRQGDIEDAIRAAETAVPPAAPPEPAPEPAPEPTVDQARDMGRAAALAGQLVTANPMPARDPRRAAWDEGWCQGSGSDGMDIPEAWQRSKPDKPPAAQPDKPAAAPSDAASTEHPTPDDEDHD